MPVQESNYELMKRKVRADFLQYDQAAMVRKFGLESDDDALFLRFFGREYRIDRRTGDVAWAGGEADYNVAMSLYDVLCCSKPDCRASGRLVNMNSLSKIQGASARREGGGLFERYEKAFDRRATALAGACARLGGVPEGKGDVGYRVPMFDFLPVLVQFWESDEEFPPQLNLFLDENILDFMHYETVWFALFHLMERLTEEMGPEGKP